MLAITGGSGFVGGHLIDKLVRLNIAFSCLIRQNSKLQGKNIRIVDFNSVDSLSSSLKGIKVLIHIAGVIKAPCENDYYRGNWLITKNIINACKKEGVQKVIYISSLAAGGPSRSVIKRTELDIDSPVSVYGKSKLVSEQEVKRFDNWLVLRPPAVFGERDNESPLIFKTVSNGIIPVFGSRMNLSMIYIHDLIDSIIRSVNSNITNEIFYISNDYVTSLQDVCKSVAELLEIKARPIYQPKILLRYVSTCFRNNGVLCYDKLNELYQQNWLCSNEKAKRYGLISSQTDFKTAIRNTINWYKTNHLI